MMRGIDLRTPPHLVRSPGRSKATRCLIAIFIGAMSAGGYVCHTAGGYACLIPQITMPKIASSFPFACNIPAQTVVEEQALNPESEQEQLPMPNPKSLAASQEIADQSGPGDSLLSLLSHNGAQDESAEEMAGKLAAAIALNDGRKFSKDTPLKAETRYSLSIDGEGRVLKATIELAPNKVFHAIADKDGLVHADKEKDVVLDFKVESSRIQDSPQFPPVHPQCDWRGGAELADKVANLFASDINLQSEVVEGDTLKVLFQRKYADDRPAGYGDVLCAIYDGTEDRAKDGGLLRSRAASGKHYYYDKDGVSVKKSFLKLPLSVCCVSPTGVWNAFSSDLDAHGHAQGCRLWRTDRNTGQGYSRRSGHLCRMDERLRQLICIRHGYGYESKYGHLSKIDVV